MMEDGRLDVLPGTAYARGFVCEYANFLGLDGDALGREALERLAPRELS
jgi:cytoskeletal protein RodZ